jgi:hypothetical protein
MENKHKCSGYLFFFILNMALSIVPTGVYEYLHTLSLIFINFNLSPYLFIFRFGKIL